MGELHPQASKQLQEDDLLPRVIRGRIAVGKRVLNTPNTSCFYGGDFVVRMADAGKLSEQSGLFFKHLVLPLLQALRAQ